MIGFWWGERSWENIAGGDEFMPITRLTFSPSSWNGFTVFIENAFLMKLNFFCSEDCEKKLSQRKRVDESGSRDNNANYRKVQFPFSSLTIQVHSVNPNPLLQDFCLRRSIRQKQRRKKSSHKQKFVQAEAAKKELWTLMWKSEAHKWSGALRGCGNERKKFTVAHRDSRMIIIGFSRTFYIKMH